MKACAADPLRGGGRQEELGTGSITPDGARIASVAAPSDIRESSIETGVTVAPKSETNGPVDAIQTIGRPTTHGEKSAGFEDLVARPPRNALTLSLGISVFTCLIPLTPDEFVLLTPVIKVFLTRAE